MKPGTLAIIVRTAPQWSCALGNIVTIERPTQSKMGTMYVFYPEVRNKYGDTTNRGQRECFQPLDDPDVGKERPVNTWRDLDIVDLL